MFTSVMPHTYDALLWEARTQFVFFVCGNVLVVKNSLKWSNGSHFLTFDGVAIPPDTCESGNPFTLSQLELWPFTNEVLAGRMGTIMTSNKPDVRSMKKH